MLNAASRIVLGIVLIASMIATVVVVGTDRYSDSEAMLVKACAGGRTDSRLDYTLFNMRAQSIGGQNAICEPATPLDEDSAVTRQTARLDRHLIYKGR